jgi:hypothetical protein
MGINNKDPIIEAINPRGNSTTKALSRSNKPMTQYQGSNNSRNGKFCVYCKILNNTQEECRKRMNENKPWVNNKGQLYWPKINSTTDNSDPNNGVGSVFQSGAS